MPHTLIFDIGKTNKKVFIFDDDYQEVYKAYTRFPEGSDEDGFPCDDLTALRSWIEQTCQEVLTSPKYKIKAINFSTYGASFVHLDRYGEPLTPLYNYLKPMPRQVLDEFYAKYGNETTFARETASPSLGMLNSGLQLYWLKYTQPELYARIRWSLHFPQYLSYLFTGVPLSEYTSIGCHTGLWNFAKKDYHDWVYAEGVDRILPPIVSTHSSMNLRIQGQALKVGVGIHDSSGALRPYIRAEKKPFLLVSTGTWSIALNPFNEEVLSAEDLSNDCLNFLQIDGKPVKAARLFLGKEYAAQHRLLEAHYGVPDDAHKKMRFDAKLYERLRQMERNYFHFSAIQIDREQPAANELSVFPSFEEAYHRLMIEMVDLQIAAINRVKGSTTLKKLFIDGGFADNDLFVKMIGLHYPELKLRTTQSPLGSALGAAMVIKESKVTRKFLKKNYALKKPNLK